MASNGASLKAAVEWYVVIRRITKKPLMHSVGGIKVRDPARREMPTVTETVLGPFDIQADIGAVSVVEAQKGMPYPVSVELLGYDEDGSLVRKAAG